MLVDGRQEAVCTLLRQSILELCKASFAYDGNDVEIDGILCISTKHQAGVENAVVKIHDQLWSSPKGNGASDSAQKPASQWMANNQNVRIHMGKITTPSPRNRSLPQKFEQKRKSDTSLVWLLSDTEERAKIAKTSATKPAEVTQTCDGANKPKAESSDKEVTRESQEPVDDNRGENRSAENCETSPVEASKDADKNSSPTATGAKPKTKKFSLDQVVSTLSENARLGKSSVNDTAQNEVEMVEVIHIQPESLENTSLQQDAFESNSQIAAQGNDEGASNVSDNFGVISIEPSAIYICDYCKQCFEDRSEYVRHKAECASKNEKNVCLLCNREFPDFHALSLHSRIHIVSGGDRRESVWKGKPLTCGLCRCVLRSKRCLQDHMREHAPSGNISPYSCVTCDYVFPEFNAFKKHRIEYHQSANNCRCENCDLFFTFKEFKSHEYECLNGKRANLAIVEATQAIAIKPSQGEQYENKTKPDSPSVFQDTDQSLDGSDVMDSRENLLIDEGSNENGTVTVLNPVRNVTIMEDVPCQGPYRCQSCFTVFQEFNDYEVHNHEMHSRFVCSFCAQSFASRRNLHRHARRHTGVKPYQCPSCDNTYTRDDDLKKHMQRVHNVRPGNRYKRTPTPPPMSAASIRSAHVPTLPRVEKLILFPGYKEETPTPPKHESHVTLDDRQENPSPAPR